MCIVRMKGRCQGKAIEGRRPGVEKNEVECEEIKESVYM